jgi:uroporphyrinogen-III synthase
MTGLPLIVTRADPGAAATAERARVLGIDAHAMPLFAARALPWSPPDPAAFDALLLTSAQAARLGGPGLAALAALPVHAVGAATARAAEAAGLRVATVGPGTAQGLFAALEARGPARILWLCGRERTAFDARGADIVPLSVYAAEAVDPPPGWAALIAAPAVVMAHSARGAARAADLAGAARKHLTLLAISPKAADAAGPGWGDVRMAAHPDDAAMLAEAHALCHKGE